MNRLFLILLLIPVTVCAAPTVSNVTFSGQQATITGTGLEKTTPAMMSYLTAEGETAGTEVSDSNYFNPVTDRYLWNADDSYTGDQSIYTSVENLETSARFYFDKSLWSSGASPAFEKVLFYITVKFTPVATSAPWLNDQIKFLTVRTYSTSGGGGSGYVFFPWFSIDASQNLTTGSLENVVVYDGTYGTYKLPNPCTIPSCQPVENWDCVYLSSDYIDGPPYKPNYEAWHTYKFQGIRATDANTADGTWKQTVYQTGAQKIIVHNRDGNATTHAVTGVDEQWRFVGIRGEVTNTDENQQTIDLHFDNLYIDNSEAVIEFGDNASYAACQAIIPQATLTTRNATTAVVDTISVPDSWRGTTKYVYVFDEAGDRNTTGEAFTVPTSTSPTVALQADKQATSPTTYTGSFTVSAGRTAATVVSSNGFTVICDDGDCTDEETEAFTVSGVTVPITDVITVTDSSAETGNDSITITLPTPTTTSGTIKGAIIKRAILK